MIVCVETNFILELAFLQEEHEECATLLALPKTNPGMELALPAYCIGEAYEAWGRKYSHRKDAQKLLDREIGQLLRSKPYREQSTKFRELTNLLFRSGEEERHRLDQTLKTVLDIARIIPTEERTISEALTLQKSRSLGPQDSIVYASVLLHLRRRSNTTPNCFITKNSKDFLNPDIEDDLAEYDCKLLTTFNNGLGYVRSLM